MLNAPDLANRKVTTMGSAIVKYFEAEVRCYHCGETAGVLRRTAGSRAAVEAFRRQADGAWIVLRALTTLRCTRCAGPLFAEEVQERYRYRRELDQDIPRRGRPRKHPIGQPAFERPGA
jgi:hypothetical protein